MLLAATLLWAPLFFLSVQDYSVYVEEYYEKCEQEKQRILEKYGLHADFFIPKSYWEWNDGAIMLLFGFVLLCAWITVALKRKNLQVIRR